MASPVGKYCRGVDTGCQMSKPSYTSDVKAIDANPHWSSQPGGHQVQATAQVLLHVVEEHDEAGCVDALQSLASAYGQTLDCMREDVAYFGVMDPSWQGRCVAACGMAAAQL